MQLETKFHGTVTVEKDQLWNFPKGLPGFEEEESFVLLPIEGNDFFQVLQSTTTASIAFIVANPYTIVKDYTFKIDEPTIDLLEINEEQDVMVLTVLTVKDPFETSTINLQAPLIFQVNNKKARQMILNETTHSMRHPIESTTKEEA